ncbi:hypothetical protein [Gimesia sp.]|uniref:hypothetical protein n=1 Tax=Gimesia sp. TaxID=2024833 RepID=UPI003A8DD538
MQYQCPECGGRSFDFDHGKQFFQMGQGSQYSHQEGKQICKKCGWFPQSIPEKQTSVEFKATVESLDKNNIDDVIEKANSDLQNELAIIDHIKITEIIPSDMKPTIGAGYKVAVSGSVHLTSNDELSIDQLKAAGGKTFGDSFELLAFP